MDYFSTFLDYNFSSNYNKKEIAPAHNLELEKTNKQTNKNISLEIFKLCTSSIKAKIALRLMKKTL